MSLIPRDHDLEQALNAAFTREKRICKAHVEIGGGVVISFLGHVRGVWRHRGGQYAYTPAGQVDPSHVAANVDAAVRHALDVVCKR
jgi:hypothetical protein